MAPGFMPTHHLLSHAGGTTGYDGTSHMFVVRDVPEGLHAGWSAADALGKKGGPAPLVPEERSTFNQSYPWPIFPHPKGKEFIDYDEDLQIDDILVDLRPHSFANHKIAQTSVARTNGVIIRDDLGDTLAYHFLADNASARFAWGCLLDAMEEFGAGPVGALAFHDLAG